ncbi:MAG: bifunctional adenosylcobinamide kinase/adenosylcobinamide-phosphate guanylyltransferase [Syntrophobacteraceae bacterium]
MPTNPHRPTPHLILGGSTSGKSLYAEEQIAQFSPPYLYIATAQNLDDEMRERVKKHKERRGHSWETEETPIDLVSTLVHLQGRGKPVLVDCLTLWLTNLLLTEGEKVPDREVAELCEQIKVADYPLFIVSNEVGSGIVPANALSRSFRDLAGFANQQVAGACRSATLVVAGIPLVLK